MDTHYDTLRFTTVASTQDEARHHMADSGRNVLVVANVQIAGRGRQGRDWIQPDCGMAATLGFTTDWAVPDRTLIPLTAAVAMGHAVESVLGQTVGYKWPNDLLVDGAKVGGILVESQSDAIQVGCGVNLFWEHPVAGAGAIATEDPGEDVITELAETWADGLVAYLIGGAAAWPRDPYESGSVTLNHPIAWDGGEGRAVGIASDGALCVDVGTGVVELRSGEVRTRRI